MSTALDPRVKRVLNGRAKELMEEAEALRNLMYDFGLLRRPSSGRGLANKPPEKANIAAARSSKCAIYDDATDDDEDDDE